MLLTTRVEDAASRDARRGCTPRLSDGGTVVDPSVAPPFPGLEGTPEFARQALREGGGAPRVLACALGQRNIPAMVAVIHEAIAPPSMARSAS